MFPLSGGGFSPGNFNFGTLPNMMLGGIANPPSGQSYPGFGSLLNFTQQPALSGNPMPEPGSALAQANADTLQHPPSGPNAWQQLIQMLIQNLTASAGGGANQSNVFSNLSQSFNALSGIGGGPGSGIYGR